jgi:predicted ester cyclase
LVSVTADFHNQAAFRGEKRHSNTRPSAHLNKPTALRWLTETGAMASTALASAGDIRAFIDEYFEAWSGTDEDRILSYYAETVSLEIPGTLMNGRTAVRDQFVRPFIAGFPGNRHVTKNLFFGKEVVMVEWSFEADHRGAFAGRAATGASVKLPGCGVYEFDPVNRQITAARIYFDVTTLLKQISSHQPQVLQNLLLSWFASRALAAASTPSFGQNSEK